MNREHRHHRAASKAAASQRRPPNSNIFHLHDSTSTTNFRVYQDHNYIRQSASSAQQNEVRERNGYRKVKSADDDNGDRVHFAESYHTAAKHHAPSSIGSVSPPSSSSSYEDYHVDDEVTLAEKSKKSNTKKICTKKISKPIITNDDDDDDNNQAQPPTIFASNCRSPPSPSTSSADKYCPQSELKSLLEVDPDDHHSDDDHIDHFGILVIDLKEYDEYEKSLNTSSAATSQPQSQSTRGSGSFSDDCSTRLTSIDDDDEEEDEDEDRNRDDSRASSVDEIRAKRLIADLALPYEQSEIISMSIERFNLIIEQSDLLPEQKELMRTIRRRGKNKVAAQKCRKRKLEKIDLLQSDVERLQWERAKLESKLAKLCALKQRAAEKYESLRKYLRSIIDIDDDDQ